MSIDAPLMMNATPKLASLRAPMDPSLSALIGNVGLFWRLRTQGRQASMFEQDGAPGEEYKSICEFMRLYATLRFYQVALLLGTTGSIVGALLSNAARASVLLPGLLKGGGLFITLAFLVMEFRSTSYWHRLRLRCNELSQVLGYQPFSTASRWSPLTTSGAAFYLHSFIASLWLASLFLHI